MKILFLNWRCTRNPRSGGAETYCYEIARRLIANHGCEVTWLSPEVKDSPKQETIDGIRFIRKGDWKSIYYHAFLYAKKQIDNYDVIIDSCNSIPFFTYNNPKSVLLIYQLAEDVWINEMSFLGYPFLLAEKWFLLLYKKKKVLTISNSTLEDLNGLGYRDVTVIEPGFNKATMQGEVKKEDNPTVTYIGRLKSNKRPDHAIRAFALIKEIIPSSKFWVIGRGESNKSIRSLAKELGIESSTKFWGYVTEEEKFDLLARTHIVIVPSVREGWGLVVIEANSVGTPAVCYDVPGLRDSTRHLETGALVDNGDIEQMARMAIEIINNEKFYMSLRERAKKWSDSFDWDKATERFHDALETFNA